MHPGSFTRGRVLPVVMNSRDSAAVLNSLHHSEEDERLLQARLRREGGGRCA